MMMCNWPGIGFASLPCDDAGLLLWLDPYTALIFFFLVDLYSPKRVNSAFSGGCWTSDRFLFGLEFEAFIFLGILESLWSLVLAVVSSDALLPLRLRCFDLSFLSPKLVDVMSAAILRCLSSPDVSGSWAKSLINPFPSSSEPEKACGGRKMRSSSSTSFRGFSAAPARRLVLGPILDRAVVDGTFIDRRSRPPLYVPLESPARLPGWFDFRYRKFSVMRRNASRRTLLGNIFEA